MTGAVAGNISPEATSPSGNIFTEAMRGLLKTKSFAFQCAFCEGFETLGPPSALAWLDEVDHMLVGADPEAVKLWKWHIMEEYEHRTVCHDVFERIHGGYFLRTYAFFYQMRHMFGFSARVQAYLLAEDRKSMSMDEIKESKRREKRASRQMMTRIMLRSMRALSPWYTPRNSPEPRNWQAYRNQIEAGLEVPG